MKRLLCLLMTMLLLIPASHAETDSAWTMGFAQLELTYEEMSAYYIAGYHNGNAPQGVLDAQRVSAVWLDDGSTSTVLIAVDCVGLDGGTVGEIRAELADFSRETGCSQINVISTHTHAGVDTLGLWGPVGVNGKNEAFMMQLVAAASDVARKAYAARSTGTLLYSATPTEGLQRDSRAPQVYDSDLYQLRFVPDDAKQNGIRIVNYAAHAEALRGANRLISRDYPGVMADLIREATGDDVLYLPGAMGGLIMTKEFTLQGAQQNLRITGEKLADIALHPQGETPLKAEMAIRRVPFRTKLENTLFIWYKFLGILGNKVERGLFGGYTLHTELTVMRLGHVGMALLPGEIFPELVSGTGDAADPAPLADVAAAHGLNEMMIVGLANDEIGYILPPGAFVLDETAPYVQAAKGHYEETNSVGPGCAIDLAEAFGQAVRSLP